jgi:peptidoglycan hydrolase CwlO-like protein
MVASWICTSRSTLIVATQNILYQFGTSLIIVCIATNTIPDCRNAEHSGLSDIKRRYDIIAEKYRSLLEATKEQSNIVDRCNADILERAAIAENMAESLEKEHKALEERFGDLQIKYDENLKEREVLEDKLEEERQHLRKKDEEYDSLEKNCKYAENQANEADEAVKKLEEKITELKAQIPIFEAQVKRDKDHIDDVEKQIQSRDAKIESLEEKLKRKEEDLQDVIQQRELIRAERNNVSNKNDAYYQDNTGIKKLLETALEEKCKLELGHKDALRRIAELEEAELNLTDQKATTDDLIAKIRDQMPSFDLNPKAYVVDDPSPSPSLKRKQVEPKATAVPPTLESELSDVDLYSASSGEESGSEREDATGQPEPEMRFADPDRLGELQVPGAATVYVNVPGRGRIVYQLVEVEVEVPGPEREVERIVEVPGPTVEVPGPERVVEGPERIVEVQGPTIYVDVPGPERVVQGPISYVEGLGSVRYLPFRTSSHNPITCWFMTEVNALMLFLYFLKNALSTFSPDNGPIHLNDLPTSPLSCPQEAAPDDETTPTEAEPNRLADLAEILGPVNEENRGETIPSGSPAPRPRQGFGQSRRMYQVMNRIQPDQQPPATSQVTTHLVPQSLRAYLNNLDPANEPHFLSTVFALIAHFIFYYGLYVCYCTYYERELWLSANAGTRALLTRLLFHRGGRHPRGILHWFLSEWMATRIDRLIISSVQLFGIQFKTFPMPG